MGNHSPSRYRRAGREAYYRGGDPEENCPYVVGLQWSAQFNRKPWLEGWNEAAKADVDKPEVIIAEGVREAFKAGWYVNATTEQPTDYLEGCEQFDWEEYRRGLS